MRPNVFFFIIIIGIYVFSWFVQQALVFNSDVSWLLLATKRLLVGGNYTLDYFEINPPIIFYLYVPAVGFQQIFGLTVENALRIYVFLLATLSLLLCWQLTPAFRDQYRLTRWIFLTTLSALFLLFPMNEFGQREQLFFILALPYFLLVAARLQQQTISTFLAILIGVLAGLGCMIKPYFLLPLVLLEIYSFYRQKKILRPETVSLLLVMMACAAIILLRHVDYLTVVVPHVRHFYYQKYSQNSWQIITANESVFAYFTLLFYGLRYTATQQKIFCNILALLLIGCLGMFLWQQTLWFYHALPMLGASILLAMTLFSLLITEKTLSRKEQLNLIVYFCLLGIWLTTRLNYMELSLRHFPAGYFILFATIFFLLVTTLLPGKQLSRGLLAATVTLLAGFAFYTYLQHSPLQNHIFLLTTVLLLLLFLFFFPNRTPRGKYHAANFTLLGLLLFAFPFYLPAVTYHTGQAYKKLYNNLLALLAHYPQQSLYFFSNIAEFSFPALDARQSQYASRFGCTGFVPALPYWAPASAYQTTYAANKAEMDFYIQAIVADFARRQPKLIFVDARNTNDNRKKTYFGNSQIDYVKFFSLNADFKKIWQQYQYIGTTEGQPLFKFRIYERKPSV